jgi:hypothetical protein
VRVNLGGLPDKRIIRTSGDYWIVRPEAGDDKSERRLIQTKQDTR